MKDNFRKSASSGEKLLRACMNSAQDLCYYDRSASACGFELDGRKQDLWLLTGDEGLACLADSISYIGRFLGNGIAVVGGVPYRDKYEYFVDCDELAASRSQARLLTGKMLADPEQILSRIHESVVKLELEVKAMFKAA